MNQMIQILTAIRPNLGMRGSPQFVFGQFVAKSHLDGMYTGANAVVGLRKLGPKACSGQLKLRDVTLPANTGSAHVEGLLDVEGSCLRSPMNRQA